MDNSERAALVAAWKRGARNVRTDRTAAEENDCSVVDSDLLSSLLYMGDRLAAALEESARDTERLDWLEAFARQQGRITVRGSEHGAWLLPATPGLTGTPPNLRHAIDAVRALRASAAVPGEAAEGR